jgi:hypothetical protein
MAILLFMVDMVLSTGVSASGYLGTEVAGGVFGGVCWGGGVGWGGVYGQSPRKALKGNLPKEAPL